MQTSTDLKSARNFAIVAIVIDFLTTPFEEIFLSLIGSAVMIFAVFKIAKESKSPTLLQNYLIPCVCMCVFFIAASADYSILSIVMCFVTLIVALFFLYKYYKEMQFLTDVPLFFAAFILGAAACILGVTMFILAFLGEIPEENFGKMESYLSIIFIIASAIELVAWMQMQSVKIYDASKSKILR